MPAAISSATWGDSPRKNHKTPSHGMVFFCIPKTTRWASGSKEAAADEEK